MPENLLALCREYLGRVTSVHALVRAGRAGYKHVGLELEVDRESPPNAEDFAGAILAMMVEHAKAEDVDHFRVDFFDANMDRLADLPMHVNAEGDADEVGEGGGGVATKVMLRLIGMLETQVQGSHNRYVGLMDKLEGLVEQVSLAMEALSGAVASAAENQMSNAEASAARDEARYSHERNMKLLDILIARVGFAGGKDGTGLAKLLEEMPAEIRDNICTAIGADNWAALLACSAEKDPATQASMLAAILGRLTPAEQAALGRAVPAEWQAKIQAAFEATLARGAAGGL